MYWKELDVLYHRSDDESDDDEPNEMEMAKIMGSVQRETKPLTIPRRSCMTVQKTNVVCVQDQREGEEEQWVVLTFFVRHYACDGDSLKMFLSFFCHVIEEQHEQQQQIQDQKPLLLPKRRVNGLQLPTSKRVEYFQLSKNEKMKIKEHGEFIALPQLIEHGCVKIRPSRAIRGILVGSLKYIFSKTTRIQVKLTDEFIREMKERTAERAPVEDYIVEDDFVSTNDIATAFAWNFLSLLNERKNKKKEQRKKPSYCNIAINYRNYGILPKNYFGNASFAHVVAVDDVYANVEKRYHGTGILNLSLSKAYAQIRALFILNSFIFASMRSSTRLRAYNFASILSLANSRNFCASLLAKKLLTCACNRMHARFFFSFSASLFSSAANAACALHSFATCALVFTPR